MRHKYLKLAALWLALISIGALLARHFGWYVAYNHTDTLLHITAGSAFTYIWFWLTAKDLPRSPLIYLVSSICFATFCAVLWELWEYLGTFFMPKSAEFYMPELGDTLSDIFASMLGSLLVFALRVRGK